MSRVRRFDTSTLILLGVAVLLIAFYWAAVILSQEYYVVAAPPGSTFSSEDTGARILINYLDELGIETNTLQQFDELPDSDATIVVMAGRPFEKEPTGPEIRRVRAWIESGGRLVMIGPYASELPQGRLGGPLASGGEEATLAPLLPSIYVQGVEHISVDSDRMLVEDPAWVTHFKDTGGQVLISRAFGEGDVVWLASLYPASNAGIGQADNARLATLLAGSRGPVYFDEYHHGFVTGSSVWDRLGGNGRAAMLMAVVALVIAIVASARRVAPAIAQPRSACRSHRRLHLVAGRVVPQGGGASRGARHAGGRIAPCGREALRECGGCRDPGFLGKRTARSLARTARKRTDIGRIVHGDGSRTGAGATGGRRAKWLTPRK